MNARFCRNCGQAIVPGMRFCAQCGKETDQNSSVQQLPAAAQLRSEPISQVDYAVPADKARRKPTFSLLLIGIILLVFGLRTPALTLFGAQATGVVTSVEQRINTNSSRMDYNFDIAYRFNARDNQPVTSSYTMGRVLDVRKLPAVGSQLKVRYWSGAAFINTPVDHGGQGYASFLLIALGVLLIIMGLRGVPVHFRRTGVR